MALPRVPEGMFQFTTTERADLHTAVMYAFGEANERLETSLTFDQVRDRLRQVGFYAPVDDAGLTRALGQLATWELLDVVQNHAGSYATAEEYERKNLQYSLTRKGEAAFAGVQHALAVLTTSGAGSPAGRAARWISRFTVMVVLLIGVGVRFGLHTGHGRARSADGRLWVP